MDPDAMVWVGWGDRARKGWGGGEREEGNRPWVGKRVRKKIIESQEGKW